jgi:adenylosuccinate synthase
VLSGFYKLKVAVKYFLDGNEVNFPLTIEQLERCIPEYIEFDGFSVDSNVKKYSDLDKNARKYLEFIESYLGVQISLISVGPGREETIIKKEIIY